MDHENLRRQRLEAGHALAGALRERAVMLEARGEADALWGLLMRWAEAAAEEEVALGIEGAASEARVIECGQALADELRANPESTETDALQVWSRLT